MHPDFGTLDDFKALSSACHDLGMKLMIDIVYNHTARDSVLWEEHPDWFVVDENGQPKSPWVRGSFWGGGAPPGPCLSDLLPHLAS